MTTPASRKRLASHMDESLSHHESESETDSEEEAQVFIESLDQNESEEEEEEEVFDCDEWVPPARVFDPHPCPDPSDTEKPVRVYADGIYDLFHFGHARSLEQAKKSFPNVYLLVGCCSDAVTHMYKGKTVMTEAERYESLRHCRWVDEVVPDAPWVITKEFLDKHQIDYVAHDALPFGTLGVLYMCILLFSQLIRYRYADASGAGNDVYEYIKSIGKFKETKRTEGISTSDIIMRMLKDYNEYVMRNLARGYTRKDLGVSYVKEKQLRVNMSITKLRQKVKEQQERVGKKFQIVATRAGIHHSEWVENADRWVAGFLEKFEEGCYLMETAIKTRIQKGLMKEQVKKRSASKMLAGSLQ